MIQHGILENGLHKIQFHLNYGNKIEIIEGYAVDFIYGVDNFRQKCNTCELDYYRNILSFEAYCGSRKATWERKDDFLRFKGVNR